MLETTENKLSSSQLQKLKSFGTRVNKFGVNFAVCNPDGEVVLLCEAGRFGSNCEQLAEFSRIALEQTNDRNEPENNDDICLFGEKEQVLTVVLKSDSETAAAALIDLGEETANSDGIPIDDFQSSVAENSKLNEILAEMLLLLAENFQLCAKAEKQIEMIGSELSQTYEELVLLHKLSSNMKVTEQDANFLQMACDSLTDIVSVEGIAILLEKTVDKEKQLVLASGSGLIDIDERFSAILYGRLVEEINRAKEALLDSEVDSPFKYDWPKSIKNIIAVPLCAKDKTKDHFAETIHAGDSMLGLMVAINRIDKPDFDSIDVKLFNSVANGCVVFIENGRLFRDLKELFIGSLKALTSSIDAKDQYTRGHSERVAFISRWIAERLSEQEPMEEEDIHKIYLAGLLHDIGKMGIDEAILRKKGKLTEQEFDCMKTHPSVGAGILSGIKQMCDIVPGVLCHHERIDGRGYPDGLAGEQIPLTGKIIGLADSFDAMTSKRTYREAMTVQEALAEIERELGKQFDEKLGRIFIDSDVYRLWDIIQDGFADVYGTGDFSEYGAVAVGTLIR